MERSGERWGGWGSVCVWVAVCALGSSARADEPVAGAPAWQVVEDASLADLRGGLRVRGFDVSLDVIVRDLVDGSEVQRRGFTLGDLGAEGLVVPLVNQRDGADIRRDTTIRVRIPGFRSAFGSSSPSRVRARIERSLR